MRKHKWRAVASVPVVALLIGATLGAVRTEKLPCEVAEEWVEANIPSLPRTYSEFGSLSPLYRKAVYNRLTLDERVTLWRSQFDAILAGQRELTPAQRAHIELVASRLPVYLDGAAGRRAIKTDLVERRTEALFGKEFGRTIFATLGPSLAASVTPTNASVTIRFANCECHIGSAWSCESCASGDCTTTASGCGYLLCFSCNGKCAQS